MKKGYWIVAYRNISDPAALQAYAPLAKEALDAYGGKVLVFSPEPDVREAGVKSLLVMVEFESLEKARQAYASEAYAKSLRVLGNAAERDLRIVEARD